MVRETICASSNQSGRIYSDYRHCDIGYCASVDQPHLCAGSGARHASAPGGEDEIDIDTVEVAEGESLEDIKAKLKPKKQAISAEMLDTANTYDDKVAVIRMIVSDEAGRVSNVFKSMMSKDMSQ